MALTRHLNIFLKSMCHLSSGNQWGKIRCFLQIVKNPPFCICLMKQTLEGSLPLKGTGLKFYVNAVFSWEYREWVCCRQKGICMLFVLMICNISPDGDIFLYVLSAVKIFVSHIIRDNLCAAVVKLISVLGSAATPVIGIQGIVRKRIPGG